MKIKASKEAFNDVRGPNVFAIIKGMIPQSAS